MHGSLEAEPLSPESPSHLLGLYSELAAFSHETLFSVERTTDRQGVVIQTWRICPDIFSDAGGELCCFKEKQLTVCVAGARTLTGR